MKYLIAITFILGIFNCKPKETLSPAEVNLMDSLGFDKKIVAGIRKFTDAALVQYVTADPGYMITSDDGRQETGLQKREGISFQVSTSDLDNIVLGLKDDLRKLGYLIFVSENGFDDPSTISIIKSNDQFDIVRFQGTDGINYEIENDEVIGKLMEWDAKYGIEIIGADYDWVEFTLKKLPQNITAFSEEVYEFCPDSVEQGAGELSELEKLISEHRRLFLWWD